MELPIVKLPSPSLRERSAELDRATLLSPDVQTLIAAMIPTMYGDDGIGLAAPQVGKNIRVCIVGKESDKSLKTDLVLVNPVWTKNSRKTQTEYEGCLSVPKKFGKVKRYTDISVEAWDAFGNPLSFDAKNFFARVIQHEVDHLNGVLFIDKATDMYDAE
jgi:peptide deformylase